jgi:curved DNA binding protein
MTAGIAFPTCVSINNCVCHNSPLEEDEQILIADGDMVKIDLAVHIDGYIAPLAETFIVGGATVDGRKADVMMAAHTAVEVALRMARPGVKTYAITEAINKVAAAYNCKALEGMLSHQLLKDKIDGEKAIIQNPTESLRKEHKEQTIEENEVYALDVIMSTGEGKVSVPPSARI